MGVVAEERIVAECTALLMELFKSFQLEEFVVMLLYDPVVRQFTCLLVLLYLLSWDASCMSCSRTRRMNFSISWTATTLILFKPTSFKQDNISDLDSDDDKKP